MSQTEKLQSSLHSLITTVQSKGKKERHWFSSIPFPPWKPPGEGQMGVAQTRKLFHSLQTKGSCIFMKPWSWERRQGRARSGKVLSQRGEKVP